MRWIRLQPNKISTRCYLNYDHSNRQTEFDFKRCNIKGGDERTSISGNRTNTNGCAIRYGDITQSESENKPPAHSGRRNNPLHTPLETVSQIIDTVAADSFQVTPRGEV